MIVEMYFFILTDECGNKFCVSFNDHSDTIHMGGYDEEGYYHTFDDDARHCYKWAEAYNFKLEYVKKEIEL